MLSRFKHLPIFAILAIAAPAALQAATFTPNVFDDPAPVAAPNGCTGQGSNPTRCSLREAALSADASDGTHTIMLGEGSYQLTIPEAGNPESGDLDFSGATFSITFQGQGPDKTKIQAGAGLNDRLVDILGNSVHMTLQGITFEGGDATGDGGAVKYSIGMSDPNDFKILNCNFVNNAATGNGGAVYQSSGNPRIDIDGGTSSGNKAGGNGGVFYLSHGGSGSELDSVRNVILSNNEAGADGGALYSSAGKGITMSNLQVLGNTADAGGGTFSGNGGTPIGVEVFDSVYKDNTARAGGGGGLVASTGGLVRFSNTTFSGNKSFGGLDGGGANVGNGGGIEIVGCTFSGNTTEGSGGGFAHIGSNGTLEEITNSTFSGNQAQVEGGGMILDRSDTGFSLNNVTIADNTSANVGGGASSVGSTVILRNTLFSGNDSAGFTDDCSGVFSSDGYNLFGSANDGDCEPDGSEVGADVTDIVGPAMIAALADNGGPTPTHALLPGSPAIDGGDPAGCMDGSGLTLDVDQRGALRPAGAECDIGAFEAAVADLAIVKTADSDTYIQGDEITYTLTVTNNGPDLSPATIEDVLPSQVAFISADAGCTNNGGTVTCDLGSLDPGESATLEITAEATGTGEVDNTATVSGSDIDTEPANDSSTVSIVVLGESPDDGGCALGRGAFDSLGAWGLFLAALYPLAALRRRSTEKMQ